MSGTVSLAVGPRFAQDAYCKPDEAQSPGSAESSPQAGVAASTTAAAPSAHAPLDLRQQPLDPAIAVKVSSGLTQTPQTHATLPPVENLYTPMEGFVQSRFGMAVEGMANPDNSFLQRVGYGVLGTAMAPAALIESVGTALYNAPNNAALAGQHLARASLTEDKHEATIDVLSTIAYGAEGFVGMGGVLAPVGARAAPGLPSVSAPRTAKIPVTSGGTANATAGARLADNLATAQAQDPRIGTILPGARSPITVTAEGHVNGRVLFDTNQGARPPMAADAKKSTLIADLVPPKKPNSNMANAHAEIGVIQQAYDAGLTQFKDMVIVVRGKAVCSYCKESSNIAAAAERAGLNSLHVVDTVDRVTYVWTKGSNQLMKQ